MKGDGIQLYSYMEGSNNRYVIPVYQRRYDWKIENCKQLYNDLLRLTDDKEGNHFFGSIVSDVVGDCWSLFYCGHEQCQSSSC